MYDLDHMLNGQGSREHLQQMIRLAQEDKFARDVRHAEGKLEMIVLRWLSRLLAGQRALRVNLLITPRKVQPRPRPALTASTPSAFLREQIGENSNHELDWLWAAERVTTPEEIRYCLERALFIHPHNRATQQSLSKLVMSCAADATQPVSLQGFAQVSDH